MPLDYASIVAEREAEKAFAATPIGAMFVKYERAMRAASNDDYMLEQRDYPNAGRLKKNADLHTAAALAREEFVAALQRAALDKTGE